VALPAVGCVLVGAAPGALGLAMAGYLCGVALVTVLMRRSYPYADLGFGNLVTLARLVLTTALLAPLLAPAAPGAVVGLALLALALDGVDGWLARRQGRVSSFGARFDMEVDAALGLILALNALVAGSAGPAVLLLGLPRYAFAAAARTRPWLARPLPERAGRKVVCVVQIGALIALQLPALPGPAAGAVVGATLAALGWSFGRDVLWLWRARP
jgi:phosphatidylglycerophosphate synthase